MSVGFEPVRAAPTALKIAAIAFAPIGLTLLGSCSPPPKEAAPQRESTPPDPTSAPWFEERSRLDFVHRSGAAGEFELPESVGGGVAIADLDGDGCLDLFFVQSARGEPHALFRSRCDGTFPEGPEWVPATDDLYGMGIATGDYDADGDIDLYLTGLGPNRLLSNDGSGRFSDVGAEAGVDDPGFGASALFFDFDRDLDLDLFVTNYTDWSPGIEVRCSGPTDERDYCSPATYARPSVDRLFRNRRDGTFEDVSTTHGFDRVRGNGLGAVAEDFNGDGWLDLFVANDTDPDRLWINEGGERFVERGLEMGCAVDDGGVAKGGMGVAVGDVDLDGARDLLVVNLHGESDSLFAYRGDYFTDETDRFGLGSVSRHRTRFGVGLHDFDGDGLLDLFQANGRIHRMDPRYAEDPYAEPNLLLRGTADGRFEPLATPDGTASPRIGTSRGVAFGDLDGDRAIDLVVVERDGRPSVLYNIAPRPEEMSDYTAMPRAHFNGGPIHEARLHFELADGSPLLRTVRTRTDGSYLSASALEGHVSVPVEARLVSFEFVRSDGTRIERRISAEPPP